MEITIPKNLTRKEKAAIAYVIAMLNTDYYFEQYYEAVGDLSAVEAFHANEKRLHDLCGVNRYADYNSFREMRRRYVNKLGFRARRRE